MDVTELVGVIGGGIAIARAGYDLVVFVRNKSRVDIDITRVERQLRRYMAGDLSGKLYGPSPSYDPSYLLGRIR